MNWLQVFKLLCLWSSQFFSIYSTRNAATVQVLFQISPLLQIYSRIDIHLFDSTAYELDNLVIKFAISIIDLSARLGHEIVLKRHRVGL